MFPKWCFTHNNWTLPELDQLEHIFTLLEYSYIIGEEVGASGTPHLQGYFETKDHVRIRPIEKLKLPFKPHFEHAKGTREQNITYCTKDNGKIHTNMRMPRQLPVITLYGWQLDAAERLNTPPDDRSVFWYWSQEGARGKSSMCRWLVRKKALICSGTPADMKYLIAKYYEREGVYPDDVVFDIPRAKAHLTTKEYTGMEEIKNGLFASTKYECTPIEMPYARMWVFANFPPNQGTQFMSEDRFHTVCVDAPSVPPEAP